jgi:hypothetical protein
MMLLDHGKVNCSMTRSGRFLGEAGISEDRTFGTRFESPSAPRAVSKLHQLLDGFESGVRLTMISSRYSFRSGPYILG